MVPTDLLGSPCAGIQVWAGRPERTGITFDFLLEDPVLGARIAVEWSPEAANVAFDWAGPYRDWWWWPQEAEPVFDGHLLARLDVGLAGWEVEDLGDGVRHTMDIAWPESAPATLRFRSTDGACNGEPQVICDRTACELKF